MLYLGIIAVIILLSYCTLIGFYVFSLSQISRNEERLKKLNTRVSIIIVGRNEVENIHKCLDSIQKNNYPKNLYEILFVDDHSEDGSIEKIQKLNISNLKLLQLKDYVGQQRINAYKKVAIAYAIENTTGELILHTDADTIVEQDWIRNHVIEFETGNIKFTSAPVFVDPGESFLMQFQYIDFISTMAITAAGNRSSFHFMANGANMSYPKKLLEEIDLVTGESYASGDDMFLVQKVGMEDPDAISFLFEKGSSVLTNPEINWNSFFKQRIRWAGKTNGYTDHKLQFVTILVFLTNAFLVLLFLMAIFQADFKIFLIYFVLKSMIDILFLHRAAVIFQKKVSFRWIGLSLCFYPFYYIIVGISSLYPGRIKWKGRLVK